MVRTEDAVAVGDPVKVIRRALTDGDLTTADAEARLLTPARTIDVMERLPANQRAVLYRLLPKQQASDVFEDLPPVLQKELIDSLQDEEVAAAFADLDPDDRVALLDEAEEMADRIGVLHRGRLVLVEEKNELMRKLGKKQLVLQLREPLADVPPSLAPWSLARSTDGCELVYDYDARRDDTGIAALLGALEAAGIALRDLRTEQSSLEDIFVQLVREES